MEPPHERAAGYLQMTWTPTDQVIMEHLLLEGQPTPKAKPKAPASPESWPTQVAGASSSSSDTDAEKSANSGSPTQPKKHKNDEDRRARHRAVQRRFVQRKKEAFQRAKRLLQELEAKYRFLRISAEERNLRHEQSVLHAHRVALTSSVPSAPAAPVHVNPVEELITTQLELVREFYEPLSSEECKAIQFSNQREYEVSMTLDESYLTSGLTIMGWHDHRKMGNESVKLALSKEFPNIRALDLMNMTWGTLSSPHTYARFFSPALTIKMQVLQTVDHDTIVIHRVLYHPQTQRASNSLELLWRTKIGAEYVIFDASLQNNAAQQCLGESYNWTQMTTSMAFGPTSADGCLFRHGGWLRRFAVSSVRYWLMEMFFMALRFESAMVAPVFALPPHESSDLDPASIDVAL